MMAAAHRHLHDIGDVPDRPVGAGEFVDDLANAALELADIDLTRPGTPIALASALVAKPTVSFIMSVIGTTAGRSSAASAAMVL
jgi:hypothetical protein